MSTQIAEVGRYKRKNTGRNEGKQPSDNCCKISRCGSITGKGINVVSILERPDRDQAHGVCQQQDPNRYDEDAAGDFEILLIGSHAFEPAGSAFQSNCHHQEWNAQAERISR